MLKKLVLAAMLLVASVCSASAQGQVSLCYFTAPFVCQQVNSVTPLPITGVISATIGGFTPSASNARGTPLTVTTSDSSGNLPTGTVVVVTNVGTTNPMYCNVNGVAATASDQLITANGGWFSFTIPAAVTTLHCIATGGSTTANTVGGSGLPTGTGGGSGGGGAGDASAANQTTQITAANTTNTNLGAPGATVCATDTGSCSLNALLQRLAQRITTLIASTLNVTVTNVNANGFAAGANSSPTAGASDQFGLAADTVCTTDNGTCTLLALLKRTNARLTTLLAGIPVTNAGTFAVQAATSDPCSSANKTNLPISQNGTSSVQLVALSGSTVIYVCSLSLIAAGATTVALTTGTGSACVTGNAAVIGTTTANIANSMSLAANGGLTLGNGAGTIAKGAASSELCMINGSNVFVSGNLTYVQQ